MQRSIFILFLSFLALPIFSQSPSPKVKEVVETFYNTYNTDHLGYNDVLFEKRKEGWYIVTQKIEGHGLVPGQKYLFYSNGMKKFMPLSLDKKTSYEKINVADRLDDYDLRNYDLQAYYGYNGWYKDVIKDLAKRNVLTDDELYGLGRAYGEYAKNFVFSYSGFPVKEDTWKLDFSINCLSAEQIKIFQLWENKSLECFKKLSERSPDYETIVGKVRVKYANEIMFAYQIYLTYADRYAAEMKLPVDIYPAEVLETPRKNLESCPPGAILLSFGDNDYYPIHYLQKSKGIRKDVYLVNYSLLGIDRYINRATYPQYEAKGLRLSVDTSLFRGNRNEIIFIRDSTTGFDMAGLASFLRSGTKTPDDMLTISANKIYLSKGVPESSPGEVRIEVLPVIPLNGAKYLFKQQWILLDIIANSNGRKICFPNQLDDQIKGLNDHLVSKDNIWIYGN